MLTPEDKQRIEAEERYRAQVRSTLGDEGKKKSLPWPLTAFLVVVMGIIALLFLAAAMGDSRTNRADGSTRTAILDCYCGESELYAELVYNAVRKRDPEAILGLTGRKQAFAVQKGDRMSVILTSGLYSKVLLTSGFHSGTRCFIPTGMVQ